VLVKSHLLDRVDDVGPSEREVLESPDEALVGRHVVDRHTDVVGELCLSIDNHGTGMAVGYATPLQNGKGVLALVKEETLEAPLHGDPEEVVERTEVLHRELTLKDGDRVLEEGGTGHREHNVVDVEEVECVVAMLMDE
jgi:hypothetical protein